MRGGVKVRVPDRWRAVARASSSLPSASHWPAALALLTLKHFADKGRC